MKLTEISQKFFSTIKQYLVSFDAALSKRINYLNTTPTKNLLLDFLKLAYRATKFILRVAVKSLAFVVAVVLFLNSVSLLSAGLILPAALTFVVAAGLLRLSGPPYTIVTYGLYYITAPIIYVAKTIGLTILDFLLDEFGIVNKVKNRPNKQYFEITKSLDEDEDEDEDEEVDDPLDLNPSIDATASADFISFELGPIKFNFGALFRYILDPFNLKNHLKKAANFLFYMSGLEDRARYLLNFTPEMLAKKQREQEASDVAEKHLIQTVNQELVNANIDKPACNNLQEALQLIGENNSLAKAKLANNQNWFHLLNKIIIADEDKGLYVNAANNLLSPPLSISPYVRDDEGSTAFKNSVNFELDKMVRRAVHGGVPDNAIGLNKQMSVLSALLENSQRTEEDVHSSLRNRRFKILAGPPGCGKTEAIKSIAKDKGFILIKYKFGSKNDRYVGQQQKRVEKLFKKAKALNKPVVLFFDEIDALTHNREASSNQGGHDAQVIDTFQKEVVALSDSKVVCFGATNYWDSVKPAIQSRAGNKPLEFGYPNYETRKAILENNLINYSFQNSEMIFERFARMYEGKSSRDLESFVADVILQSEERSKASKKAYNNELSLEDFEYVHEGFIKSESSWMQIIYPKVQVSENKCDEYEIPHLDAKILEGLENVSSFFDRKYPNICSNSVNNLEAALFTGFSAVDFKNTIANHNTKCATIYFDAAKMPKDFAQDLVKALESHMQVMLVIDNIESVKDNSELKRLLLDAANKGRTIYVMGTTETTSDSHLIWPDIFAGNIEKIKPIKNLSKITSIIQSIFDIASKRKIAVKENIMDDIPKDTLGLLKGMTINKIIRYANEIIGGVVNSKNFKGPLLFSSMESRIAIAQKKQQAQKAIAPSKNKIKTENRAKVHTRYVFSRSHKFTLSK